MLSILQRRTRNHLSTVKHYKVNLLLRVQFETAYSDKKIVFLWCYTISVESYIHSFTEVILEISWLPIFRCQIWYVCHWKFIMYKRTTTNLEFIEIGFSILNHYKHWRYQVTVFPLLNIIPWKHENKYFYSIWFYGNMWFLKYVQLAIYSRCYHNLASSVDYSYQEEYCSFLPWYHFQYKKVDTFTQKTNMH